MEPCPIVFEPILRPKVWGGRKLAELFDKQLPEGTAIGESWECADLDVGQSIVARGPARGRSLRELVRDWGEGLLGRARPVDGKFPLLIKFLDANENLSIQVHPDPQTAARQGLSTAFKHEAWHIVHAAPNAVIYRGLNDGVRLPELARAVRENPDSVVQFLKAIPVKPGQTYYLPSGILHALGAGVVVAEVQTPSDVTYRLYDWGRTRAGGDAGLHVEQALASIRIDLDPSKCEHRAHVAGVFTTVTRIIDCPHFKIEKVRFTGGMEHEIPYAELVCWIVLEGNGQVKHRGGAETFRKGEVMVLPAALKDARVKTETDCVWLEVTIPATSDLAAFAKPTKEALRAQDGTPGAPISIKVDAKRKN